MWNVNIVQVDSCHRQRPVQRAGLALRTAPAQVLRDPPLARELCTPPLELVPQTVGCAGTAQLTAGAGVVHSTSVAGVARIVGAGAWR